MRLVVRTIFHQFVIFMLIGALGMASAAMPTQKLTIGKHIFNVEIAASAEEQKQGLMFRQNISAHSGMLFPQPLAKPLSMWMKNTLIPLDMVFIGPDKTIVKIEKNTTPESLDEISSEQPVIAVLELKGGICDARHINVGDKVDYAPPPVMP